MRLNKQRSFLLLPGVVALFPLIYILSNVFHHGIVRTFRPALSNADANTYNLQIPPGSTSCRTSIRRFGHYADGGWDVCLDELDPENCVVYSVGISNDPSFDLAIGKFGCQVYAFDPTIGRSTGDDFSRNVHFYNVGLSSSDKSVKGLGKSEDKTGAAAAAVRTASNTFDKKEGYTMKTLSTLMAELGHDFVDILKIDIEGYEWRALNGMLDEGLLGGPHSAGTSCSKVGSILAELHFHKNEVSLELTAIRKLRRARNVSNVSFSGGVEAMEATGDAFNDEITMSGFGAELLVYALQNETEVFQEFLKVYTHNVDVAVGVLGRIRKAGFEVYSRVENWRFGTEMKLKDIVAWNCIEVGLMLPNEFRCQRKSQKEQ